MKSVLRSAILQERGDFEQGHQSRLQIRLQTSRNDTEVALYRVQLTTCHRREGLKSHHDGSGRRIAIQRFPPFSDRSIVLLAPMMANLSPPDSHVGSLGNGVRIVLHVPLTFFLVLYFHDLKSVIESPAFSSREDREH